MGQKSRPYTLTEKRAFIDADFKKSTLVNMPELPADPDAQRQWWKDAVQYASDFSAKYADKGDASKNYALELVCDWMDTLERMHRKEQL